MYKPISIIQIIQNSPYKKSPEEFFGGFKDVWDSVKYQVLKLETRQSYQEPGNISLNYWMTGDFDRSLKSMKISLSNDDKLYRSLKKRHVDFIRCRPIKIPFSKYLKWEMETYKITEKKGERIFCCNYDENKYIFSKFATHDFMVFDDKIAFVHDYDKSGLIRGGWVIKNEAHIYSLQSLFILIKSKCNPFYCYIT